MLADSMRGCDEPDEQAASAASSAPAIITIRTFPPVRTTPPHSSRNTVGQQNHRRRAEEAMISRHGRRLTGRGRGAWRAAIVAGGAVLGVLALAGTAFAHVTITPASVPQGSTAELTFKVPNEESSAATVELQLQVPTAHPIAQFLVKPVPGWTISVRTVTLAKPIVTDDGSFSTAVSEVTWTGGKILPGQYQDFSVSADPLPSGVGQVVFKAIQTYSNE